MALQALITKDPEVFLPYGRHQIDEDDIAAVTEALRSSHLTQGPLVEHFEQELAAHVGARHLSVVSNGTIALQLAYSVLGLGPGDELITSPITFVATANAARNSARNALFTWTPPRRGGRPEVRSGGRVERRLRGSGGLPA